jgi:hypothetical protein
MKRNATSLTVAIFCILLLGATGSAQVQRVFVHQIDNGGQGDLADTVTNDVFIDFTGELRGQLLMLNIEEGSIYQHPMGAHLPPDASLLPAVPNLEFDTFLAMGGANSASSFSALHIRNLEDPVPFGDDFINAKWAPATGVALRDRQDFLTARITLTENAQGTWRYFGSVAGADPGRTFGGGVIANGVMTVPEPESAMVSGVAWICGALVLSGRSLSSKGAN